MALVAHGLVYLSLEGHEPVQVSIELLGVGLRGRQLSLLLLQAVAHVLLRVFQLREGGGARFGGLGDRRGHLGTLRPASLVGREESSWKAPLRASYAQGLGGLPGARTVPAPHTVTRAGAGGSSSGTPGPS